MRNTSAILAILSQAGCSSPFMYIKCAHGTVRYVALALAADLKSLQPYYQPTHLFHTLDKKNHSYL